MGSLHSPSPNSHADATHSLLDGLNTPDHAVLYQNPTVTLYRVTTTQLNATVNPKPGREDLQKTIVSLLCEYQFMHHTYNKSVLWIMITHPSDS